MDRVALMGMSGAWRAYTCGQVKCEVAMVAFADDELSVPVDVWLPAEVTAGTTLTLTIPKRLVAHAAKFTIGCNYRITQAGGRITIEPYGNGPIVVCLEYRLNSDDSMEFDFVLTEQWWPGSPEVVACDQAVARADAAIAAFERLG